MNTYCTNTSLSDLAPTFVTSQDRVDTMKSEELIANTIMHSGNDFITRMLYKDIY